MEVVAGILSNVICHPALAPALAAHPVLPQALVACALSECLDSVALTATCRFLDEACACEVRCSSPPRYLPTHQLCHQSEDLI